MLLGNKPKKKVYWSWYQAVPARPSGKGSLSS